METCQEAREVPTEPFHQKDRSMFMHVRMVCMLINTSYQKLPFGSGDYPDKLLFHQALN